MGAETWKTRRARYGDKGHATVRVWLRRFRHKVLRTRGKIGSVARETENGRA
jgi:hypothetical protein